MASVEESVSEINAVRDQVHTQQTGLSEVSGKFREINGQAAAAKQEIEGVAAEAAGAAANIEEVISLTMAMGYTSHAQELAAAKDLVDESRGIMKAAGERVAELATEIQAAESQIEQVNAQLQQAHSTFGESASRLQALTSGAPGASGGGGAQGGAAQSNRSGTNGPTIPAQRGSAPKPTKSHGTRQKRAGITSGPVIFSVPRRLEGKLTGEHRRQAQEYVDAGNQALRASKLSKTGRVRPSQDPKLKNQKENAARKERDRAAAAGTPYGKGKVAAHLPDTTWAGTAQPPGGWGSHDEVINSSLGSQSDKYPVGYKPTGFELDNDWDNTVDDEAE